jgi:selenoprotein W-related protein
LAAEVEDAFAEAEVKLVESSGGRFEVSVNGELIFSKKKLGRHADPGEVVGLIQDRMASG